MALNPTPRSPHDDRTASLFHDLVMPPSPDALVKLRGLKHPVWTEQKAQLIAAYLRLFTYVTKHGTYIDGFAGQQNRTAKRGWAAELVLDNRPRWLRRFYLCDASGQKVEALQALKDRQ